MNTNSFDYVAFQESLKGRFQELHANVEELAERYQQAKPFPFILIDDFLPTAIAEAVAADIPDKGSADWKKLPTEDQKGKHVLADESKLPVVIRDVIQELNSGYFVRFLEKLTG